MTQPTRPTDDRQFARDVAKQLDRRRVKRKLTLWTALLAVVAAGAAYLRCGNGLGLGGLGAGGGGRDDQGDHRPAAAPARCSIWVTAAGFSVGDSASDKVVSRDQAVAACKGAAAVDIHRTGDARSGDTPDLVATLHRAGFKDGDIAIHPVPMPAGAGSAR